MTSRRARIAISLFLLETCLLAGCANAGPGLPRAGSEIIADRSTRWIRPTPRPAVDTTTQLTNLSSMPGTDLAPSVAVHPTEGWAVITWANVLPEDPSQATVFVKVQDPATRAWQPGVAVNTQPAPGFASHPDLAIDSAGRLHVVFSQDGRRPHYSRSEDFGHTWSQPEALPLPPGPDRGALFGRVGVDAAGLLHILFINQGDCDCLRTFHLRRLAIAPTGTAWHLDTHILPGTKHLQAAQAFLPGGRTLVVAGCAEGCSSSRAIVATNDGPGQPWQVHTIAGEADQPGWVVNWVSAVAVPGSACVAWGYYARSGNYPSCSFDRGDTWEEAKPIVQTPDTADARLQDTGSTPELLYDPATRTLMSIALYRQAGDPLAIYPIYSYRRIDADHWVPRLAGPFAGHQPALRLFPATRRSLAATTEGIRLAFTGSGLAWAVWAELERDENMDIYAGQFNPAALLAEVQGQ